MTVAESQTVAARGRPSMTQAQQEAAQFHRIADLAIAVLGVMRKPNRHAYSSERQLRGWLAETIQFSASDVGPALALLEATGLLERPAVGFGQPRPGRLPGADKSPEPSADIKLARTVVAVCQPGNGRSLRVTREEIGQRLIEIDIELSDDQLSELLVRLCDVGQLQKVRQAQGSPIHYVANSRWPYDETDALEAEICKVLRDRDEGYEDESELKQWLTDAGVVYDDVQLGKALGHLSMLGRLQFPKPIIDGFGTWGKADYRPVARKWLLYDPPIYEQSN